MNEIHSGTDFSKSLFSKTEFFFPKHMKYGFRNCFFFRIFSFLPMQRQWCWKRGLFYIILRVRSIIVGLQKAIVLYYAFMAYLCYVTFCEMNKKIKGGKMEENGPRCQISHFLYN